MKRVPLDVLGLGLLAGACAMAFWQRPEAAKKAPPAIEAPEPAPPPLVEQQFRLRLEDDGSTGSSLNREGVELARDGHYREAVAKLRAALAALPGNALIRRNLQAVLTAWGFEDLRGDQSRAAADHFTEALGYGRTPEALSGFGVAQVRMRQYTEGIAALEEAMQRGAKDGVTLMTLGDAYEATDDRVHALEMFQRASEAGVRSPELQARIARLAREVDAEWDFASESSRHFEIRFDAAEDRAAANEILHSLESAYDVVGRKFGYFPDRPTPVVLYADRDFHDVTQTPDWAGGVYDGRLKFPVRGLVAGSELDRVVRHEYAHSLIAALANSRVPAWLNEGLAMWAEEDSPGDRRDWAEGILASRQLLPLSSLSQPFANLPREVVHQAYAQSYLTVLVLVDQYDERRLPRLLEALRHGSALAQAFADVYPLTLPGFEEAVARALG